MTSAMLTYVLGTIPTPTLAALGNPTDTVLAPILADAITQYGNGATVEADCTNTVRFNAIGRALFWAWAVERMQSASIPGSGGQSEFQAHVSEMRKLRDYYAEQVPGSNASIQQGTVACTTDPYVFPRYSDR
jgi:hypothetical protein